MSKTPTSDLFTTLMARENLKHDEDHEPYGLVSFNPPTMPESERAPLDLAVALDRSGSMDGGVNSKMEMAKRSLLKLIEHLTPSDRLSLVIFDTQIDTILEPTKMTPENKKTAIQALNQVNSRGGTNLSGGLLQAIDCLSDKGVKGTVRRCLLFTDGQANAGIQNAEGILMAANKTRGSTPISTFGYGTGCNSELLEQLAVDGGNYHYIDTPDKILSAFGVELGGLVSTYGQNVQVTLTPTEGVEILGVLNDLSVKENDDGTVMVTCDDLLAEQPYHLVLHLKIPSRKNTHPRGVKVVTAVAKFYDVANTTPVELTTAMKVKFVKNGQADTKDNPIVMEEVALQKIVQAQAQAMDHANAGNWAAAQGVMINAAAFSADVGTTRSVLLGDAARGMSQDYFSSHTVYEAGGAQKSRATKGILRRRSGGSKGLDVGGVNLDSMYANEAQTGTRAVFEDNTGTGDVPADLLNLVGTPVGTPVDVGPMNIGIGVLNPQGIKSLDLQTDNKVKVNSSDENSKNSKNSLSKSRSNRW